MTTPKRTQCWDGVENDQATVARFARYAAEWCEEVKKLALNGDYKGALGSVSYARDRLEFVVRVLTRLEGKRCAPPKTRPGDGALHPGGREGI